MEENKEETFEENEVNEKTPEEKISNFLMIKPLKTDKDDIKVNKSQELGLVPKHAFSALVCGKSGSGKTMMLLNLMTRPEFYKDYFDEVFVISDTAKSGDDLYKRHLGVKEDNIFEPNEECISNLEQIITKQKEYIKQNSMGSAKKLLIIFDDIAHKKKFLASDVYLKLHIANRHFNISCFSLTQSYVKIPRSARCQVSAVFFFHGCTQTEAIRLSDEHTPARYTDKEFLNIIDFATNDPYDFLFINKKVPMKERYRKCLHTVLELNK
jgi:hypothetical protein